MKLATSFAASVFVCLAAGCGGTTLQSQLDAGPPAPTAEAACTARATAECTLRDGCSNHWLITRTYGDLATCIARLHDTCVASLAAPNTAITATIVQACATAYPSIACNDYLNGNLPASCLAQPGPGANGTACRYASQCQSGYCAVNTGSACGACAAPPVAGALCDGAGGVDGCGGHGMACVGASFDTAGHCNALVPMGGTCDTTHECAAGLSCTPVATTAMNRTCQPAGSTLTTMCAQATNPGCDTAHGLTCNGMTHLCTAETLAQPGQACGINADGSFTSCAAGGDCMGYVAGTNPHGVCRAAAADGAACDRHSGPFCRTPASCVVMGAGTAGICQLPTASACH